MTVAPNLVDIDDLFRARHDDLATEECARCGSWTPGQPLTPPRLLCATCLQAPDPPTEEHPMTKTQSPNGTITAQQRLTIVKHLANGRGLDFTAAATGIPADQVRDIGSQHGWPREESLAKAADILARRLDDDARSAGITERPDLRGAVQNSKHETRNANRVTHNASRTETPSGGAAADSVSPRNKILDSRNTERDGSDAKLATPDAKSTGHRVGNGGQPFDATAALLLRGRESTKKRTQNLAQRISDQLADLRDRLDEEDRERRQAEKVAKEVEEARAEVERLEKELRAAREKARAHNKGYTAKRARSDAIKTGQPRTAPATAGGLVATTDLEQRGLTSKSLRAWAREHHIDCPDTGRVPRRVLDAYDDHQQANTQEETA